MAGLGTYTCFFYGAHGRASVATAHILHFIAGTLMNVDILCRVIGTSHDHLEFAGALLKVPLVSVLH